MDKAHSTFVSEDKFSNRERRLACVVIADTSGSMSGEPIAELNRGLILLRDELLQDAVAKTRVEIAIVAFDSNVRVAQAFSSPMEMADSNLTAQGATHMGSGIARALDHLEEQHQIYRDKELDYYKPWAFLLTDGCPQGEPEDRIAQAAARVRKLEAEKRLAFFAIGVGNADMDVLAKVTPRPPLVLKGHGFREFFHFVSTNCARRADSSPSDPFSLERAGDRESCFRNA